MLHVPSSQTIRYLKDRFVFMQSGIITIAVIISCMTDDSILMFITDSFETAADKSKSNSGICDDSLRTPVFVRSG